MKIWDYIFDELNKLMIDDGGYIVNFSDNEYGMVIHAKSLTSEKIRIIMIRKTKEL